MDVRSTWAPSQAVTVCPAVLTISSGFNHAVRLYRGQFNINVQLFLVLNFYVPAVLVSQNTYKK
jgi:hypothetical protein